MPKSELATISEQQASSPSEVIRRWLVMFGELYRQEITPALVEIWCRLLSDLEPKVLEEACEQTAKKSRFFPNPGDIRALIDQAEELDLESEAEDAWQGLLDSIARDYIPDIGRSPGLAWDMEHAARAAGGLSYLESCPRSELVWARKRFIEDFLRTQKTGQAEHLLLSQRGFQRLLAQVSEVSSKSAKPLGAAPERALPPRCETAKAARAAVDQIIRPMPAPPSEEEIARRKAEQKQRLGIGCAPALSLQARRCRKAKKNFWGGAGFAGIAARRRHHLSTIGQLTTTRKREAKPDAQPRGFALLRVIPRGTRETPRGNCEGCGLPICSEGGYRVPGVRGISCSIECVETVLFGVGRCRWCGKKIDRPYTFIESRLCSDDCAANYWAHVRGDRTAALGTGKRLLGWLQRNQPETYHQLLGQGVRRRGTFCQNPNCKRGENGGSANVEHLRAGTKFCSEACSEQARRNGTASKKVLTGHFDPSGTPVLCGFSRHGAGSLVSHTYPDEPGQKTKDLLKIASGRVLGDGSTGKT